MRTFAIVNQKGGSGKTTTAINIAAMFARRGLRTLLVDMDPQSHCATGLGVPEQRIERSVSEALLDREGKIDPTDLVWEVAGNLDLIPSTMRLAGLEAPGGGLHTMPDRDQRLAGVLQRMADRYDRCLIDCSPTIGLLTFNALCAARETLIPVETGYFAFRGAENQWRTIHQLIQRIGRPIACHILPTLYDESSALATDILGALRRQFAGQILPVVIHSDDALREAASFGQPVIEYAPNAPSTNDYKQLVDWLEDHPPRRVVNIEVLPARPQSATNLGGGARPILTSGSSPSGPGPSGEGRAEELARRVRGLRSRASGDAPTCAAPAAVSAEIKPTESAPKEQASEPMIGAPAPRVSLGSNEPTPPTTVLTRPAPAATRVFPATLHPSASPTPSTTSAKVGRSFGARPTRDGVVFAQPGSAEQSFAVAGDFNDWSPRAHVLRYDAAHRRHQAIVNIPPGRYCYRLIVNGQWKADPHNIHTQQNEYGEPNSILVVPRLEGSA